jgi:L-seryl-tRNA(Ser) seleniumtransferase
MLVGRSDLVARLKRHPLTRAIRPDKGTLAALGATLVHYVLGEAEREVPVWRMIAASPTVIESRARAVVDELKGAGIGWEIGDGSSAVGGGSLPGETLPTRLLMAPPELNPVRLATALRQARPAVVARIERDRLVLDLRTVLREEDAMLASVLRGVVDQMTTDQGASDSGDRAANGSRGPTSANGEPCAS